MFMEDGVIMDEKMIKQFKNLGKEIVEFVVKVKQLKVGN